MRRWIACFLSVFLCQPALAIYRCDGPQGTTYSDRPCTPVQRSMRLTPAIGLDEEQARRAASRAAQEQAQARRLQAERERRIAAEDTARARAEAGRQAHDKRCKLLEMKKSWSEEDAARAPLGSQDRARRAARRKA